MPKVSVIIPTYNRANYICEAIDSVIAQTCKDYEIIVVDDGSTDNTKDAIKKYDGKIRYIYQKNRGVAAARNAGIRQAVGRYIAFCDSDDIWLPLKLEKQLILFEENLMVGFVYCFMLVESKGALSKRILPSKPAQNFSDLLIYGAAIPLSSVVIRKEWLLEVGFFDESMKYVEDYDLWLRILLKYKEVKYIQEPLAIWRQHGDNISSDVKNIKQGGIKVFEKLLQFKDVPKKLVRKNMSSEHYLLGKIFYENGKNWKAAKETGAAILANPLVGLSFVTSEDKIRDKVNKLLKPYFVFLYLSFLGFIKNEKI